MKYNPAKHHRRSIRLPNYDYTAPGVYFITICVHQHECLFGEVVGGEMMLNPLGHLVQSRWRLIPRQFSRVNLDDFVVMPNHMHAIVTITDPPRRGKAFGRKSSDSSINGSSGTAVEPLDIVFR